MNQSSLLAIARRKFGKKAGAYVRQYKNCPSPKQKADAKAGLAVLAARKAEIEKLVAAAEENSSWRKLLAAARFVVDVNGDSPSISQLETLVEVREWVEDWRKELADIRTQQSRLRGVAWSHRYEVCTINQLPGLGPITTVEASGDSLDEVAAKIQGK